MNKDGEPEEDDEEPEVEVEEGWLCCAAAGGPEASMEETEGER